jgi:ATP-dependent DNA helicase DinG
MIETDLLHARQWAEGLDGGWLAMELVGSGRVFDLVDGQTPPPELPAPILVNPGDGYCAELPGGTLLVSEEVLWSFLDPLQPRAFAESEATDRLAAETELRNLTQRFRARVSWWQVLDVSVRDSCRRLLKGRQPDLTPLLDILDQLPVSPGFEKEPEDPVTILPIPPPPVPLGAKEIYSFFQADEGMGVLYGRDFISRSEQSEMGSEVASALEKGDALMLEAGTGVGKTLAYLVPLISAIRHGDKRAVVSTHTKALQSQILDQDLPRLEPLLEGRSFNLLMGRSNYLCLRQRLAFFSRPVENLQQALRAAAFRIWLHATGDGLREELEDHPLLGPDLDRVFFHSDMCLPGQCYEGNKCYVQRARRKARDSDLLVVNHSLLMNDLKTGHTLLGDIDHLVVDEAHRLPGVALETHGIVCGSWRLEEIAELLGRKGRDSQRFDRLDLLGVRLGALGKDGEKAASAVEDFARGIRVVFSAFRKWWQALGDRVDEVMPAAGQRQGRARVRDKDEAFGMFRVQTSDLLEALAEAENSFGRVKRTTGVLEDLSSGLEDDLAQVANAGNLVGKLHHDVRFLTSGEDEEWVTWVEPAAESGVRLLGATMLEAGGILAEYWSDAEFAPIMTSATLAVGEDFTHLMGELGLTRRNPPTLTFTCPSPFDYHKQIRIFAPRDFPAPGDPGFGRAVGEVMRSLGLNANHKTMGLYTSYRMIRESVEVLGEAGLTGDERTSGGPVVLAQAPRIAASSLVDRFRRHRRAMLLGTSTFWEGVDFPGRDLEVLVVTKLPFLVPNDPWVEARCEKISAAGENPFTRFMVRDAILRLRQGFGRLIRRVGDRGVVIILDNRLHTKNYGVTFLGALPVVPDFFDDSDDLIARIDDFFLQR